MINSWENLKPNLLDIEKNLSEKLSKKSALRDGLIYGFISISLAYIFHSLAKTDLTNSMININSALNISRFIAACIDQGELNMTRNVLKMLPRTN